MMDTKEKLVELLKESDKKIIDEARPMTLEEREEAFPDTGYEFHADFLIAHGVTVQECGVWIGEGDGFADGEIVYDVWYCENCNHCIETDDYDLLPNFCPNCGMKKLPLPQPPEGE